MGLEDRRAADRPWAGPRSAGVRLGGASYALRPARPIEPRRFERQNAHIVRLDGQLQTLEAFGSGEGQRA